ncbi:caspase domain-containing protein [Rhodocollybia butyracea]|uniref:Caspase domain-containing protein n=1 Tax=Rhodocollybia butyracea TaxID=206335 RepID=A0A9P5P8C2_9AGAR|nr:caspase domain-containing protein [Rhodocollybia butyracea]
MLILNPSSSPGTSLTTRGFNGGEIKDDGRNFPVRPTPGFQGNIYDKNFDLQDLPAYKLDEPTIMKIVNQLKVTKANIEERTKEAHKLWKARHATEIDIHELLKELQHRHSAGELVGPTLRRLNELGGLNRKKQELISLLWKAYGSANIDVSPQRDLSNGLNQADGHRFHVVIVGINKYDDPRTPSLKGCVNDALLFRDYVMRDLSVPADQITTLLSRTGHEILLPLQDVSFPYNSPTRENILNALYDLRDNPHIDPNDSIIIFYAGHGQSYRATDGCTPLNTGHIEAISPVDRNTVMSSSDGTEIVVDISHHEINIILGEIAKKCPNITLILDCCHASGGTSGCSSDSSLQLKDKEFLTPRRCPPIPLAVPLMFKAADKAGRLPPNRPSTASPDFRANMTSHVLIAAAKDYQEALEFTDSKSGVVQGYFTSRFVSVLRSPVGCNPTTTYCDLIRSPDFVMPFQTAVAAGRNTARLWFRET